MTKAIIIYGTRYGAAASTAQEIAQTLNKQSVETRIVDAKHEKVKDITPYDLVVVGSGIQINRWTKEPEDFLKHFQKSLAEKKVALFVCCGSASKMYSDKTDEIEQTKAKYLDEKAAKYSLQPVALGFFGGVYNFNKVPWWSKKAMDAEKPKIAAAYKEVEPDIFDTRDHAAIQGWARSLMQKAGF